MKTKLLSTLALLALLIPASPVLSQGQTIAEVENLGDMLVFHPFVEFERLVLTVTGSCGFEYRQVVTEDEIPVFQLDSTVIDGPYTYSLMREERVDPSIIKILRAARANFDEETPKALCRDGKLPPAPTAQSDGFLVSDGKIIFDPRAVEKRGKSAAFTKDFVINDDLIVDGSACIGFDCVNGESFGFDTIRLKENNLRIKFDDTSTASSFPRNDWQLTANDSANGGASKFSIDDISGNRTPFTVEANARSHALYVDDGGRIGSRTSTPSVEIHTIDGDTPTLRLQQDGSSGFAPQTWDVAGNETNFFIRDVTNGSQLPLRIRPDAPTNSVFIDVDGDVGMGTSSPQQPLHVVRSGAVQLRLENTGASGKAWNLNSSANGGFRISDVEAVANVEFDLNGDGDLVISGELTTGGATCGGGGCDQVFRSDELASIEEHAALMWENSYLPAVGPTPENQPMNLSAKTGGMLNELEMAHIYIEQLHRRLARLEARLAEGE